MRRRMYSLYNHLFIWANSHATGSRDCPALAVVEFNLYVKVENNPGHSRKKSGMLGLSFSNSKMSIPAISHNGLHHRQALSKPREGPKKAKKARINGRQRLLWLLDKLLGHVVQTSRHTIDSSVVWKTECQARSMPRRACECECECESAVVMIKRREKKKMEIINFRRLRLGRRTFLQVRQLRCFVTSPGCPCSSLRSSTFLFRKSAICIHFLLHVTQLLCNLFLLTGSCTP
jgi:hypothetical protein